MKIIGEREKKKKEKKKKKKNNSRKEQRGDPSYTERVRARSFSYAFKLVFSN